MKTDALRVGSPRLDLALCLTFILSVVATPVGWFGPLFAEACVLAFAAGLRRQPLESIARRGAYVAVIAIALACAVALNHPARLRLGYATVAASLCAKSVMALCAVLIVSGSHAPERLIGVLRSWRIPVALTTTLYFMSRYLHILSDERDRMLLARRSRTFGRRGARWSDRGRLVGTLLVRAVDRGDRVYGAMVARGWDGTLRSLDDPGGGTR